jgi:hypothetical protein
VAKSYQGHTEYHVFDSFTDYVNYADEHRHEGNGNLSTNFEFYGVSFSEAVRLARQGWPEGWQAMKALRDSIFGKMASQVQKDKVEFRVSGGAVNVGRFLSGRPDCFQTRVKSPDVKQTKSKKVLRVVINTGARAAVSPETFFARGAAAVTLIEALERAGYRVIVDMVSLAEKGGYRKVHITTRIKQATSCLQLDQLAFILAHISLHRRLTFAVRGSWFNGQAGGSVDVPLHERGDIYFDCADTTASDVWLDPKKAQAHVRRELEKHGVTLKEAA